MLSPRSSAVFFFSYQSFSRNNHWSKYSYVCGASSDPLKPYTVGGVFNDAVQQTPDREFLVSRHENKRYTFAAMDSEVSENWITQLLLVLSKAIVLICPIFYY